LAADLVKVAGAAATGDFNQSDVRALRRLMPYQNLFYWRGIVDATEAGVNDALDIRTR
jgi:hypothetical protein